VEANVAPGGPLPDFSQFRPVRTREPDASKLVALSSRSHATREEAALAPLGIREWRRLGSSLKFCLLARGEGDLYVRLGNTSEWDTAAGHAVLAAAGGCVTSPAGAPLDYGHHERGFINPGFAAWGRKPLIALE
jgi:3'(2'), 5'-bisphosphate nucleotidase